MLSFGQLYVFYNTKYTYLVFVLGSRQELFLVPIYDRNVFKKKTPKHCFFVLYLAALGLGCCSQAFSNCV